MNKEIGRQIGRAIACAVANGQLTGVQGADIQLYLVDIIYKNNLYRSTLKNISVMPNVHVDDPAHKIIESIKKMADIA